MAREVHDTVAKGLVSVLLHLRRPRPRSRAGRPDEATAALAEARAAARFALEETRRSVLGLAPSPLEGRSLEEALERELAWANRTGAPDGPRSWRRARRGCPPDVAHALFRIAQEALTNALHHADATLGADRARLLAHGVSLLVQDDGAGFDRAEVARAGSAARHRPARDGRAGSPAGRHARGRVDPGLGDQDPRRIPSAPERRSLRSAPRPCGCSWSTTTRCAAASRASWPTSSPDAVVGEAGSGGQAILKWRALRPDVVLMDLRMPDGDGVEAIAPSAPRTRRRASSR